MIQRIHRRDVRRIRQSHRQTSLVFVNGNDAILLSDVAPHRGDHIVLDLDLGK